LNSQKLLEEFENFVQEKLKIKKSFHPHFHKAYLQMFQAGGKRFRPLLLLNVVDAYQPQLVPNAMFAALSIEMFHTYSLIHDDLPTFDDANLRRGVKTLHITYDEVTATLIGDALNSDSFLLLSNSPFAADVKVALIKTLAQNGGGEGMVLGQALDCYFEDQRLSLDELKFLHIHKTAKLIAASLKMGAIIANLSSYEQKNLYDMGIKIGLLFQIQDDIIDATMSEDEAGKPTNSDTKKNSFTNLMGVKEAIGYRDNLKDELLYDIKELKEPLNRKLEEMIKRYFS